MWGKLETKLRSRIYIMQSLSSYELSEANQPYSMLELSEANQPYSMLELSEANQPYSMLEILREMF